MKLNEVSLPFSSNSARKVLSYSTNELSNSGTIDDQKNTLRGIMNELALQILELVNIENPAQSKIDSLTQRVNILLGTLRMVLVAKGKADDFSIPVSYTQEEIGDGLVKYKAKAKAKAVDAVDSQEKNGDLQKSEAVSLSGALQPVIDSFQSSVGLPPAISLSNAPHVKQDPTAKYSIVDEYSPMHTLFAQLESNFSAFTDPMEVVNNIKAAGAFRRSISSDERQKKSNKKAAVSTHAHIGELIENIRIRSAEDMSYREYEAIDQQLKDLAILCGLFGVSVTLRGQVQSFSLSSDPVPSVSAPLPLSDLIEIESLVHAVDILRGISVDKVAETVDEQKSSTPYRVQDNQQMIPVVYKKYFKPVEDEEEDGLTLDDCKENLAHLVEELRDSMQRVEVSILTLTKDQSQDLTGSITALINLIITSAERQMLNNELDRDQSGTTLADYKRSVGCILGFSPKVFYLGAVVDEFIANNIPEGLPPDFEVFQAVAQKRSAQRKGDYVKYQTDAEKTRDRASLDGMCKAAKAALDQIVQTRTAIQTEWRQDQQSLDKTEKNGAANLLWQEAVRLSNEVKVLVEGNPKVNYGAGMPKPIRKGIEEGRVLLLFWKRLDGKVRKLCELSERISRLSQPLAAKQIPFEGVADHVADSQEASQTSEISADPLQAEQSSVVSVLPPSPRPSPSSQSSQPSSPLKLPRPVATDKRDDSLTDKRDDDQLLDIEVKEPQVYLPRLGVKDGGESIPKKNQKYKLDGNTEEDYRKQSLHSDLCTAFSAFANAMEKVNSVDVGTWRTRRAGDGYEVRADNYKKQISIQKLYGKIRKSLAGIAKKQRMSYKQYSEIYDGLAALGEMIQILCPDLNPDNFYIYDQEGAKQEAIRMLDTCIREEKQQYSVIKEEMKEIEEEWQGNQGSKTLTAKKQRANEICLKADAVHSEFCVLAGSDHMKEAESKRQGVSIRDSIERDGRCSKADRQKITEFADAIKQFHTQISDLAIDYQIDDTLVSQALEEGIDLARRQSQAEDELKDATDALNIQSDVQTAESRKLQAQQQALQPMNDAFKDVGGARGTYTLLNEIHSLEQAEHNADWVSGNFEQTFNALEAEVNRIRQMDDPAAIRAALVQAGDDGTTIIDRIQALERSLETFRESHKEAVVGADSSAGGGPDDSKKQ